MIQSRIKNKFLAILVVILIILVTTITIQNFQTNQQELIDQISRLELQNDAINKQIEVEKTEKSQLLTAERQLYEQTKKDLNQKLREQKQICDKDSSEAKLRFNSLQQNYKILNSRYDDLDEHCQKEKKELATENDGLKSKLDKVQGQLSKIQTSKDNDGVVWKTKYESLLSAKEKLEKLMEEKAPSGTDEHQQLLQLKYKTYQLEQENKDLKQRLNLASSSEKRQVHQMHSLAKTVDKSFGEQIPVSEDHYKIPIAIRNKSNMVMAKSNVQSDNGIINSVENFQIIPKPVAEQNVLQQPMAMNGRTTTTTTPTSVVKKENLAMPASSKIPSSSTQKTSAHIKPLPKGFLPIPDIARNDAENEIHQDHLNDDKKSSLDETLGKPQDLHDVDEMENVAHEINDNDFNIDDKNQRNHMQDNNDQDRNMLNNAAEEMDVHKPLDKKSLNNDAMDLEIINRPANAGNVKLNDEIQGDHGKEPDGYPDEIEDLRIEGQQEPDDLGDVGEYDDPKALQKGGAAERN